VWGSPPSPLRWWLVLVKAGVGCLVVVKVGGRGIRVAQGGEVGRWRACAVTELDLALVGGGGGGVVSVWL
jgi:hypothetical protein